MAWLRMEDIYGDVGRSTVFQERFAYLLGALWDAGVEKVVTRYLNETL